MKAFLKSGGLAAVLAAATTAAVAQTPQRTTATYGDWTVRCEAGTDASAARICEMVQSVTVQGQAAPIAQIALGPRSEGGLRLVVQLPITVWLPTDVKLSAGDEEIVSAEFKRCFPQFCLAEAEVPDTMLEDLRARSGEGAVAFQDAAQRDVSVPLSFNGIADAYAALAAETASADDALGDEAEPAD